jgi:hypothetical protein
LHGLVDKAKHAWGEARRQNPALPRPISGAAEIATIGGNRAVVLQLVDGSVVGYAEVPAFRLQRLSAAQVAVYQRYHVEGSTDIERLDHILDMAIAQLAVIETKAKRALAKAQAEPAAANGDSPMEALLRLVREHFAQEAGAPTPASAVNGNGAAEVDPPLTRREKADALLHVFERIEAANGNGSGHATGA